MGQRRFIVQLIKPSRYDDDGYGIQWTQSWLPLNPLACLYAITQDVAAMNRSYRPVADASIGAQFRRPDIRQSSRSAFWRSAVIRK